MEREAAYLRDKIEVAVNFYETRARAINASYLAQVEKLAKRIKDPVLADFFRDTVRPDRIAFVVDNIRTQLKVGQVVEADKALEKLKQDLEFVEQRLRYPFFETGAKQRAYLDSTRTRLNAKRKIAAERNHAVWAAEAQNIWERNPRLTITACAKRLIAKFKLKARPKTVEDAIRYLRSKKVGGAG